MIGSLITFIRSVINLLPSSFILDIMGEHLSGVANVIVLLKHVNYFVPIYHLVTFMNVWLGVMSAVLLYYSIKSALSR